MAKAFKLIFAESLLLKLLARYLFFFLFFFFVRYCKFFSYIWSYIPKFSVPWFTFWSVYYVGFEQKLIEYLKFYSLGLILILSMCWAPLTHLGFATHSVCLITSIIGMGGFGKWVTKVSINVLSLVLSFETIVYVILTKPNCPHEKCFDCFISEA